MKTKLVVGDEHTLGYINPLTPDSVHVFRADVAKGAIYTTNPIYNLHINQFKTIRLASEQDFNDFRISFAGFNNTNEYLYQQ